MRRTQTAEQLGALDAAHREVREDERAACGVAAAAENEHVVANDYHSWTLVKRFDTESFSDSSAKLSNFRGLVLGCMDSYDSDQRLILQGFSRSTRFAILCTAQISKILSKIVKNFAKLNIEYSIETAHFFHSKRYFSSKWRWNFAGISRTCSKMSKFTENCRKFAKFWQKFVEVLQLVKKINRKIQ